MLLRARWGMDATKPSEFIWFGAMDATKPCEFIWFGAMDATKPYEFIEFGELGIGTNITALPHAGLVGARVC